MSTHIESGHYAFKAPGTQGRAVSPFQSITARKSLVTGAVILSSQRPCRKSSQPLGSSLPVIRSVPAFKPVVTCFRAVWPHIIML